MILGYSVCVVFFAFPRKMMSQICLNLVNSFLKAAEEYLTWDFYCVPVIVRL